MLSKPIIFLLLLHHEKEEAHLRRVRQCTRARPLAMIKNENIKGGGFLKGANLKHQPSHTDSVRLRLLLKIGFEQFWDAQGSPKTPQTTPGEGRDAYKNLFD